MSDGATAVSIVGIVFGFFYLIIRAIFAPRGRRSRGRSETDEDFHNHRELFDLAMRLQSRVESLERLLDSSQPEWRGKP